MSERPEAAVIEIIEADAPADNPTGMIVPNDVRINGQSLLCSADDPVIVHSVSTRANEPVRVTLTLFARRVEYRSEP